MYIGIHINDTFIATAATDQHNKAVLIKDESIESNKQFINPLKIYIEDEFAYLGNTVHYLLANNRDLNYASHFLDALADIDEPIYKDNSGTDWNAVSLLAIFLKKIKTDTRIYKDSPIQGAAVTIPKKLNSTFVEALKLTFDVVNIPLKAVLDMEEAAIAGYHITNTSSITEHVLLYYLDSHKLTVSLSTLDEVNTIENKFRATEEKLGEQQLYERLFLLLTKRYEQITDKKIRENKQNFSHIEDLVFELIAQTVNETKLYMALLCAIDNEVIELIVTRAQVSSIIEEYVHETIGFLENEVLKDHVEAGTVDTVLCAGNSKLFPIIKQELEMLFHREDQHIHSLHPEEVLAKGAAIYANTEDKAIDKSLLTEIVPAENSEGSSATKTDGNNHEAIMCLGDIAKRFNTIHINNLGEII